MVNPYDEEMRERALSEWSSSKYALSEPVPDAPFRDDARELYKNKGAQFSHVYDLFPWEDTVVALIGENGGFYDVFNREWLTTPDYEIEPCGGCERNYDEGVVAFTSYHKAKVFLWDGETITSYDTPDGENVAGNIAFDGTDFYFYTDGGNLYRITPDGAISLVSSYTPAAYYGLLKAIYRDGRFWIANREETEGLMYYDFDADAWGTYTVSPWSCEVVGDGNDGGLLAVWFERNRGFQPLASFFDYDNDSHYVLGMLPMPRAAGASRDVWHVSTKPFTYAFRGNVWMVNGLLWSVGWPYPGRRPYEPYPHVGTIGFLPSMNVALLHRQNLMVGNYSWNNYANKPGLGDYPISRTGISFLRAESVLRPVHPPSTAYFWRSNSIDAGDTSQPLICGGWESETLYFLSDTDGTLTIEVDPVGNDEWSDFDTVSISANSLETYPFSEDFGRLRVSFDTAATVTASMYLR